MSNDYDVIVLFSGTYDAALMGLRMEIADMAPPVGPMDAQMASPSG